MHKKNQLQHISLMVVKTSPIYLGYLWPHRAHPIIHEYNGTWPASLGRGFKTGGFLAHRVVPIKSTRGTVMRQFSAKNYRGIIWTNKRFYKFWPIVMLFYLSLYGGTVCLILHELIDYFAAHWLCAEWLSMILIYLIDSGSADDIFHWWPTGAYCRLWLLLPFLPVHLYSSHICEISLYNWQLVVLTYELIYVVRVLTARGKMIVKRFIASFWFAFHTTDVSS